MSIQSLEPTALWGYFHQLNQIPRPSKHEEKIQAFIMKFGEDLGLETSKDSVDNIIIRKPATIGLEGLKMVVLQSHLDMVPQANKDKAHNFATDPIETMIDGDWVTANGTTLGADNGIGVAAIMAVLASKDIPHGPIEALLTSDEETGMTGALGLKGGLLKADILLNLDSEDEGEIYISCAGGVNGTYELPLIRETLPDGFSTHQVVLNGLLGGHSGINIIDQRGNANKLLARWLISVNESHDVRLISFKGGNLRNAIPREGELIIAIKDSEIAIVKKSLDTYLQMLQVESRGLEKAMSFNCSPLDSSLEPLKKSCQTTVVSAINACHNGVYRMSFDMKGLVETSNNLAVVETSEKTLTIKCLLRSAVDTVRDQLAQELASTFRLAGATKINYSGGYPGWKPNPNSEILTVMEKTGEQIFGKVPEIKAMHAGLECGILGSNYPHWDMISFGPTIRGAHSPDEKVDIKTVATFYDWLLLTLKSIPVKGSIEN